MQDKMSSLKDGKSINIPQPNETFLRQVLFMKDDDKIMAMFPFFHSISDKEYMILIDHFFSDSDIPPVKTDFCLMHEASYGWGWIHNNMIDCLEVAKYQDYKEFKTLLIERRVIREEFILNEE